jgi:hypothetical protein
MIGYDELLLLLRGVTEGAFDAVVACEIDIEDCREPSVLLALGRAHATGMSGNREFAVTLLLRALELSNSLTLRDAAVYGLADAGRPDLARMKLIEFAHGSRDEWERNFYLNTAKNPRFTAD